VGINDLKSSINVAKNGNFTFFPQEVANCMARGKFWNTSCLSSLLLSLSVDDAAYNRAISPAGQLKQPLLYLPPPPQHPPPMSAAAGTQPQRHLSTDDTCEDEDIYSRIPASSSEAGDHYPPSLPLVDYYTGHLTGYDVVDSGSYNDGLEDSLPPPHRPSRAPTSKLVSASPQLQRRVCDQVTHLAIVAAFYFMVILNRIN